MGVSSRAVEADLATAEGVDELIAAGGRPVDALPTPATAWAGPLSIRTLKRSST